MQEANRPFNPFPGLRPFKPSETHLFFGRDGQSKRLLRQLGRSRFLAVVGASGSGKSSLVSAGLLPALQGGLMSSAGSGWRVAVFRPGHDPIGNLAQALTSTSVFGSGDERDAPMQTALREATLRRSGLGLLDVVREARDASGGGAGPRFSDHENLLVVVDQFEELFRFKQLIEVENTKEDAAAFVKLLLEAAAQRDEKIYVVLTMRSDFLGDCAQFQGLPEAINAGLYLIPRMSRDERREAITRPVAVGHGQITAPLVNRLLNDVGDNPDQLPILQHALMRTWDHWKAVRRNGEPIDLPHYLAIGGMSEALSLHAEEAYGELGEPGQGPQEQSARQRVAEKLFKALAEQGPDNREVRRPVELREACEITGADAAEVAAVVEVFRRAGRSFLMPPSDVKLDDDSLIDISHESLIRNWKRLKDWTDEEAQSARIYRRLAETAVLHGEGREGLLKDPALAVALDWRTRNRPNAAWARRYHPEFGTAMSFLAKSATSHRRNRLVTFLLAFSFILTLASAVYAFRQGSIAEKQRLIAEQKTAEALTQQHRAEEQSRKADEQAARADRERASAVAASDEAKTQRKLAEGEKKKADEQRALAEQQAALARANETKANEAKARADQLAEKNRQLLYPADINLAQQAYRSGNVERARELLASHAPAAGERPGFELGYLSRFLHSEKKTFESPGGGDETPGGGNTFLAVAPAGGFLAYGAAKGVKLRDINTGETRALIEIKKSSEDEPGTSDFRPGPLAVSPDSKFVAVGNSAPLKPSVKLFEATSGKEIDALDAEVGGIVRALAFSPDGNQLFITGGDNMVRLSDVSAHKFGATARRFPSDDTAVETEESVVPPALSPDGRLLATSLDENSDEDVQLWDVATGEKVVLPGCRTVSSLAFSPESGLLAVGSDDSAVTVWSVRDIKFGDSHDDKKGGDLPNAVTLQPFSWRQLHASAVSSLAYSPGNLLAIGYQDGTIILSNSGARVALATLKGHTGAITSLAFSPDGKLLFSGDDDASVKSWDVVAQIDEQGPVTALEGDYHVKLVALSPDGSMLAAAKRGDSINSGNTVILDATTRQPRFELQEQHKWHKVNGVEKDEDEVNAVAYSPDGKLLATASMDKAARLWVAADGRPFGAPLNHASEVLSVAFSRDGRLLATGTKGGEVVVWEVASGKKLQEIPNPEGEDESEPVDSLTFLPDGKRLALYRRTRQGDNAHPEPARSVELWDWAAAKPSFTHGVYEDLPTAWAFSPAGDLLALGYENGSVSLHNTASDKEVGQPLKAHRGKVVSLAFRGDGGRLVTVGSDGAVKLWDMTTRRELITIGEVLSRPTAAAFSLDGRTIATIDRFGDVKLWHEDGAAGVGLQPRTVISRPRPAPRGR